MNFSHERGQSASVSAFIECTSICWHEYVTGRGDGDTLGKKLHNSSKRRDAAMRTKLENPPVPFYSCSLVPLPLITLELITCLDLFDYGGRKRREKLSNAGGGQVCGINFTHAVI